MGAQISSQERAALGHVGLTHAQITIPATLNPEGQGRARQAEPCSRGCWLNTPCRHMWVVVKIRVPFWVP